MKDEATNPTIIPTLSIRSPWWWWILYGGKNIENRSWHTTYRGPILIHASTFWRKDEIIMDNTYAASMAARAGLTPPETPALPTLRGLGGHVVGRARIVDCIETSDSPWLIPGNYGFVLDAVTAFKNPWPVTGKLGFFKTEDKGIAA